MSPRTDFQKAELSTKLTYNKIEDSNTQKLQESLDQARYKNVTVEDCLNFNTEIETEADVKEIENFNNSHQNSKEEDDVIPKNLSAKLRSYHDALYGIRELQELLLHCNNSEFFSYKEYLPSGI